MAIQIITTTDPITTDTISTGPTTFSGSRATRTAVLALAAVAAIGALAGCGGGSSPAASSTSAASTSAASAAATPEADSTYNLNVAPATRSGSAPTPQGDDRTHLIYILEAVNPKVSTDESALVQKSVAVCGHMLRGDSATKVGTFTRKQFSNGSYTPSPIETQAIDLAITGTFCR